jgi:hypothetical protein
MHQLAVLWHLCKLAREVPFLEGDTAVD